MENNSSKKVELISFNLNETESAAAIEFMKEHRKHSIRATAGEAFLFHIMPTMIGDCFQVECMTCGKKLNVTDYSKF